MFAKHVIHKWLESKEVRVCPESERDTRARRKYQIKILNKAY